MIPLEKHQSLEEIQQYVADMEVQRGFSDRPVIEQCLQLGEEVGEVFKAVRKHQNIHIDPNSKVGAVGDELADVLIYLCAIANRMGIDLADALRSKEAVNEKRTWVSA
ncbi:MazG nucleotide pyrophosphohydrolase domain-containing protein [Streptomyces sp. SL13]|uniref:MazG nucleotide pyrophosphohydrolase domain-containing protein n=1 Tax=Streptantibioticus silvisoli TaxID=2705255 RepID=A0AA90KFV4_9ACTN|nr:MazG nucleotide pyrophosphohydrolase domain-containing protein [Streptantibioticus silvisoli]MDI5969374.1 MazG nucleotide pyrophosphohydrolase domain-containing protein [Streptantibioticus silvisoli]